MGLCAGGIFAAQGQKILRAFDGGGDFFQQFLQVFVAVDEIDLIGVDDEQVGLRVVEEKVFVGFDHFHQVILTDGFLVRRVLFLEALFQYLRRGLQIDDQVGSGDLFAKIIEVAIVGIKLLIVKIEAGKKFVFFKNVIRDNRLIGTRTQIERAQLFKAPDEKCQLRLKRSARLAIVERFEKGIVFRFDNPLRGQTFSENPRQRALSHAYGTFDRYVTGKLKKLGHELSIIDCSGELESRIYRFASQRNVGKVNGAPAKIS